MLETQGRHKSSNAVMFSNTLLCASNTIYECSNMHVIALIIKHVIKLFMYVHKITFSLAYKSKYVQFYWIQHFINMLVSTSLKVTK